MCTAIGATRDPVVSYKNAIRIPNIIIGAKPAIFVCSILNKAALSSTPDSTPNRFLTALYKNPLKNISSIIGPRIETNIVKNKITLLLFSSKNISNTG